ncbi:NADH-quinone oxidoreductase subunit L [Rhodospirillum rubrum]|uniref:NADH-ubiquinone oxidoreductase chain 5 n=1 Tax=Rhodospirillum rubrum (strain ATCC 11170 / ATH 1.1.1 / DSM 467 / LMG 4362 / NCIMB 8255 / S1) TaxID=269796 RepID=Q2RU29_RHORT|nr:NADH-quinone oxidoreductase subunit L [Rhodospirillum rubrum]ABC22366.1 NADH-plastoquinone oxidoreductase, chain 5 [Rhodospirillum rubrum ATCC 11170]AEO48083.1 NADH:ubiquinone oxidoreductase subunit L [Rhodospirillum rubrum F11]MBK5953946.1 NADH-quinone oxidoreductase subunit L [Rhodospirillum rubrum]QXG82005.1 NADH-quinone oxidoreductase subunit L [Rhodospirillum rubrum]HAQ01255.1 NADH-quinone oxidoreductase subunit L [Rhodospirillum rubrum]
MLYFLAVFLPLLTAIATGFFGRALGDKGAQRLTCLGMAISALFSWFIFFDTALGGNNTTVTLFTWVISGDLHFDWALKIDTLSAVMLMVVTTISFMVHIYSVGYMHHDASVPRFMAYLSLFTFFMLMLVTADNLVQMFFGWEGVGLASYLLIGFWYEKPSANAAAIKAFVVNRVGDFGFTLGIFGVFFVFGTVGLDAIFAGAAQHANDVVTFFGIEWHAMTILCLLLFIGAMGKSAQLGLHTWLPDAMEGPTPVSALIHAATMVTAGVFMVARMSPLFVLSDTAMTVVTIVGASTAIFAATVGCVQNDIKRVIAYSTCSQLGYMFFALGVGAFGAGIFHLMTHAFFKALLFLGAGSVIHAMSDEQDMRRMGGIWRMVPLTYALMWIGSLALMGVPPFAGFFSKDMILEVAYAAHGGAGAYAFWLGILAATLTAFYSTRLIIMTFHGAPRADEHVMAHVHESPRVMTLPLIVLAIGAVVAGGLGADAFIGDGRFAFWGTAIAQSAEDVTHHAHDVPGWVKLLPLVVTALGVGLGVFLYGVRPKLPAKLAASAPGLYRFLLNKWYFDELYDRIFIKPAFLLGRGFWKDGDGAIIDGVGPDGVASATRSLARWFGRMQTGYLYHYAFAMITGIAGVVTWVMVTSAH